MLLPDSTRLSGAPTEFPRYGGQVGFEIVECKANNLYSSFDTTPLSELVTSNYVSFLALLECREREPIARLTMRITGWVGTSS